MADLIISSSFLGGSLADLLLVDDLEPGSDLSYQVAKAIYLWHPLGGKMADAPIKKAQSQQREIAVGDAPDQVTQAFRDQWRADACDSHIANLCGQSRVYGIASMAYGMADKNTASPIDPFALAGATIYFSVFDPLNTSGSLVLNQDPNAPDFQKPDTISVSGDRYHRSRTCVLMNEKPIYIAYTNSAFGYVGRSVYQRALYPLKSFVQSMITDDMVTQKAGFIIAKQKQPGSIINNMMAAVAGLKREMVKGGRTGNVLSIDVTEDIQTLNMMNVDGAGGWARTNVLKNIATAADMPAIFLENETMAEGFGEGTEDAKAMADYIDAIRQWMQPGYDFMDPLIRHRAWTPEFFERMKEAYPDLYAGKTYKRVFYEWTNAFSATWPNLLKEPDSELVKVADAKLKALIALVEVMAPNIDPTNKIILFRWVAANINVLKLMFPTPLEFDWDEMLNWAETQAEQQAQAAQAATEEPSEPKPESATT